MLFRDAMLVTGMVSHQELAIRSSIGFYLFVPPGENERLLAEAGFALLRVEDVTGNFDGLQRFLSYVRTLSVERRLPRYAYLAEKPAR